MTIEFNAHVDSVRHGGRHGVVVVLTLEMDRANGQLLEVQMSHEEARYYMPGSRITLRFWPNGLHPVRKEFVESNAVNGEGSL